MTILEYLRKLFRDDPVLRNYDISEGSNYYDLVYMTLNNVLSQSLVSDIVGYADIYDINKLENLSYNDVAVIAAQYGIPAPFTNYSSGDVRLIFNTPVDVTLPVGTVFEANGNKFLTSSYESVLAKYLESNTKTADGKYQSQPITVYNSSGANVEADTLGITSLAVPELARIENDAITNGTAGSSKEILASLVRAIVRGLHSGTEASITAMLRTLYPNLTAVEVVSGSDDLMTRNLMINAYAYGVPAESNQDFRNKVYGNNATNPNLAFYGTSETEEPPDIDSLYGRTELSQYQYINVGNEDSAPLLITTDNEFIDTFAVSNNIGATAGLDCGVTEGDNYFYAYGAYWIEPGISVNLEGDDIGLLLHKTQVIVRDVAYRIYNIASIESTEDPLIYRLYLDEDADEIYDKIKEGQIIDLKWVRIIGEDDYDITITVDAMGEETTTGGESSFYIEFSTGESIATGDCDPTYPGKAIWNEYQIVGTFSLTLTDVSASIPDDISVQIGSGWIVSEHGYPVGFRVSDNAVYVENERVVMGGDTGSIRDPFKDMVMKGGVGRFVGAVLRALLLRRTGGLHDEAIPVVDEYDEMMDR